MADISFLSFSGISILAFACVAAYFLKGFSGFGPAPVFVPVVAMLVDVQTAISSSAFIDLFVGFYLLFHIRITIKECIESLPIILVLGLGTVIGASSVGILPEKTLLVIVGLVVVLSGLNITYRALGRHTQAYDAKHQHLKLNTGAFLAGLFGGLTGISGPFIAIFAKKTLNKSQFRRLLVFVFLVEGIIKLIIYSYMGVWTEYTFTISFISAPMVIIGIALGLISHNRISETRFNLMVGTMLMLLGMLTLLI